MKNPFSQGPSHKKDRKATGTPKGPRDDRLGTDKQTPAAEPLKRPLKIEKRLELPEGALLAFCKSGGFKFVSHELVIFPNGNIKYGSTTDPAGKDYARKSGKLSESQVAEIRALLERVNFFRASVPTGKQSPDTFAYEIVARVGAAQRYVEVFDGAIPAWLTPLLQKLGQLLA